jgi:anti-anti-sigma regulatory factor
MPHAALVVTADPVLDVSGARRLLEHVRDGASLVTIDLGQVERLDTAGLQALLAIARDRTARFVNAPEPIRRDLEWTGAWTLLERSGA